MLTEKIIIVLARSNIISEEDRVLYEYGFHQGFILLGNIFTSIIIGWFFSMVAESIIFFIAYIPLRSYAGGYHAKTPLRCYFFSIALIIFALSTMKLYLWDEINLSVIATISTCIITLLGPVESENKPLGEVERDIFKKQTNMILVALNVLAIFLWFISERQIAICIVIAVAVLSIMLLLGKIKNLILSRNSV